MKTMGRFAVAIAAALVAVPSVQAQEDRLWGEVITVDGDVYEGFIRWDRNEVGWADLLNGSRDIEWRDRDEWNYALGTEAEARERSIEFLGIRISWDDDESVFPTSGESGIRFGHIDRMTVTDRQAALLRLRSGEVVEFRNGSTDIGTDIREIRVDDPRRGIVELEWRDLDEIIFAEAPRGARPTSDRLYGTVEDRRGISYTGYISWDLDEVLTDDILDGDENGRDREVPFFQIAAIERTGFRGSLVTLVDGTEMRLEGSNDVDDGHRGVQVSDPAVGQIDIPWDEFASIRFHGPDLSAHRSDFDGGERLYGTVETDSGERITGFIRWDADEAYTWEILDGSVRDIVYDIEFGEIERIERNGFFGADVTLKDGRVLELEDSNDIDEGNRGIFIETEDGEKIIVDWLAFRSVIFGD